MKSIPKVYITKSLIHTIKGWIIIAPLTLWFLLVVVTVIMAIVGTATATPLRDPGNQGVIRWPNNTVIHVYIPDDPDGLNRHVDLANGIREWNNRATLQNRGITIQTHRGAPPPGATNAVTVEWVTGTVDTNLGQGGPSYTTDGGNTADDGRIRVSRDTAQVTNQMARNLGIHETGHVLGLDDVATAGAAMNPNFTRNDVLNIGAADDRELGAVYAANVNNTQAQIMPQITQEFDYFRYAYALDWISGQELALFQVSTSGAQLFDFVVPSGWEVGKPMGNDVILVQDNLYLDVGSIYGYKTGDPFVSFVLADDHSYLGPNYPHLEFGFSSFAPSGGAKAFLNGSSDTLGPVPEPSTLLLLGSGLAGIIGFGRKRLFKKA